MRDWSNHHQRLRTAVGRLEAQLGTGPHTDGEADFSTEAWNAIAATGLFAEPANTEMTKGERLLGTMYALERLGEISRDAGFNFSVVSHIAGSVTPLAQFGSRDLNARYLDELVSGRRIGAHAISEPEAGSDAANMLATATVEGDDCVLHGDKAFVTNGPIADVVVVYAKLAHGDRNHGISAFLVNTDAPGLEVGERLNTMGLTTSPLSPLRLDGVRVPASNMIGRPGAGFLILDHVLKREILYAFIVNVGEMSRRLQRVVDYVKKRRQFGRPIGAFQSVSNKVVDMKMRYELSRCWLYHAAEKLATNKDATSEVAIGKILASESALASAIDAMHVHGGTGYLQETGLPADVANALAGPTYSGTNEIQRNRIAAMMGIQP